LEQKKRRKLPARWGGLRVFELTLEPLGYSACSILNADLGGLRRPFDRARGRPSSSRRMLTASSSWDIFLPAESRSKSTVPASGAASLFQIGLKPKDVKAASAWPRKL
jgi:hypothetical protein